MTQTDLVELAAIEREIEALELWKSPSTFAQNITRNYTEQWEPYPHLAYINEAIVDLIEGRSPHKRLLITTPPRHGKSLISSVYTPAWYLNRYPDMRVILSSYGDDFAATWGRQVRDLIENNAGKLAIRVSKDSSAANRWSVDGHRGRMVTAGVGGQLTGLGANLFIIDDPVKDAVEASSAVVRDQKWDWWRQVAQTRLEPGGVVILIQTRWHEDDLAGRILLHEPELWTHINLPALAEEDDLLSRSPGEALCPPRYDENALGAIRTSIGTQAFSALYQQRPQPEGGGAFKKSDFRYWYPQAAEEKTYALQDPDGTILVPQKECWRFVTMDLALTNKTTSDYTVAAVWDVAPWLDPSRLILVHVERTRIEGAEHVDFAERLWKQYKPTFVGVEEAMQGSMTMSFLQRKGVLVRALKHKSKDKPFRAKDAELLVENHRVYFPKRAEWLGAFEHELLLFPSGTHDDQVDVLAYAAKELLAGVNMARKPKEPEPDTLEARCWAQVTGRGKNHNHPMLGAWH